MDIRGFFGGGPKPSSKKTSPKKSSPKKSSPTKKRKASPSKTSTGGSTNATAIDMTETKPEPIATVSTPQNNTTIDLSSEENNPPKRQKAESTTASDKSSDEIVSMIPDIPETIPDPSTTVAGPFKLPKGKPLCLQDKFFVVTGVLPNLEREDCKQFIMTYGGQVKTAVSGRTHYLVVGPYLEDGRKSHESKKYQKAEEKNVKIITEAELMEMVRKTYDPFHSTETKSSSSSSSTSSEIKSSSSSTSTSTSFSSSSSSSSSRNTTKGGIASDANDLSNKEAMQSIQREAQKARQLKIDPKDIALRKSTMLWADKHKPKKLNELLGNGGHVRTIRAWLNDWSAVHLKKTKTIKWNKTNPGAKAALVSGPPGIGKSSM